MSRHTSRGETLEDLRQAFDAGFANGRTDDVVAQRRFVLGTANGVKIAMEIAELSGVVRAGTIVPLANALPGLAGLTGVRMRLVPVWRLGKLLLEATSPSPQATEISFLALCHAEEPVALGLDAVEGLVTLPETAMQPLGTSSASPHIRHHLLHNGLRRPVASIAGLLQTIQTRTSRARSHT